MKLFRSIAILTAATFALNCLALAHTEIEAKSFPVVVVTVENLSNGITYSVDGKRCDTRSMSPTEALLRRLSEMVPSENDQRTIAIVITGQVPIEQLGIVRGVAMKVGFARVRNFVQHPTLPHTTEITYGGRFVLSDKGQERRLIRSTP
jgi:hypothetical protein